MIADRAYAIHFLKEAAGLVMSGWSQKASARNEFGEPVAACAHVPPNIQKSERPYAPVSFDVGSAIWRAASQGAKGKSGSEGKMAYHSIPPSLRGAFELAMKQFHLSAGTIHHSIWNDDVCKSKEQARDMLLSAAKALA